MTGTNTYLKNNEDELRGNNIKNLSKSENHFDSNDQDNSNYNPNKIDNQNNKDLDNKYNNTNKDFYRDKKDNNNHNNNNIINNRTNNFSEQDEEGSGKNIKLILIDEINNKDILSDEQKHFIGERIRDKIMEGGKLIVITKDGEKIKLDVLKSYEGEILTDENGNAILGNNHKYFIDKTGEIIVSSDRGLIGEEKTLPVKVKAVKFDPYSSHLTFRTTGEFNPSNGNIPNEPIKNNYNFGTSTIGFGGGGTSDYKKKYVNKTKLRIFPQGEGNAKPPLIKKRKRKFKK